MDKIQQLTDKLYQEGVEKGSAKAREMEQQAQEKSREIIAAAEKQAKQLIEDAQRKAGELEKNTKAELQLFARQAVEALRTEVTNLINGPVVEQSVKAATADKDFMQKVILQFVQKFAQEDQLLIETAEAAALTKAFEANAKDLLDKGLRIESVNGLKTGFVIRSEKGAYKIQFGEEELIAYFKEFLRPQLVGMLFTN